MLDLLAASKWLRWPRNEGEVVPVSLQPPLSSLIGFSSIYGLSFLTNLFTGFESGLFMYIYSLTQLVSSLAIQICPQPDSMKSHSAGT